MQKLTTLGLIFAFAIGMTFAFVGGVDAASDEGLEESPAFQENGVWVHENGAPMFDTDNHRIAVPGEKGAENANLEKSVIHNEYGHDDKTSVDPHRTLE